MASLVSTPQSLRTAALSCTLQGSAFYLGGCAVVVYGWTVIGLILEAYGFWLLFCEFFPTVLQFLRKVPVLSKILDLPLLKLVSSALGSWWGGGAWRELAARVNLMRGGRVGGCVGGQAGGRVGVG